MNESSVVTDKLNFKVEHEPHGGSLKRRRRAEVKAGNPTLFLLNHLQIGFLRNVLSD